VPNRIIRDSLLDSDRYHELTHVAERLLFIELLLIADDYGLMPLGHAFVRRRATAAANTSAEQFTRMLSALADVDLLRVYVDEKGNRYGYLPRFGNWPRALKSRWPLPPDELGGLEIKALMAKRSTRYQQPKSASDTRTADFFGESPTSASTDESPTSEPTSSTPTASEINELGETCSADAVQMHPETEDRKPYNSNTESIRRSLGDEGEKLSTDQAPKKPPRRQSRCPVDFAVTAEMRAWALANAPNVDVDAETAAMRDHEFVAPKSDWPATWRNWLRTAAKRNPAPRPRVGAQSADPPWRREQRERMQAILGPAAARQPTTILDNEPQHASARLG
jgi:hypothetical protein